MQQSTEDLRPLIMRARHALAYSRFLTLLPLQTEAELCASDGLSRTNAASITDQRRFKVQIAQSIEEVSAVPDALTFWRQLPADAWEKHGHSRAELQFSLQVDSEEWNATAIGSGEVNPFVLHGFLQSLETSSSAVLPALYFLLNPALTTKLWHRGSVIMKGAWLCDLHTSWCSRRAPQGCGLFIAKNYFLCRSGLQGGALTISLCVRRAKTQSWAVVRST